DRQAGQAVQWPEAALALEDLEELRSRVDRVAEVAEPLRGQRSPQHRTGNVVVHLLPEVGRRVPACGDGLVQGDGDVRVLGHAAPSCRKAVAAASPGSTWVQVMLTQPRPRRRLAPRDRVACPEMASTNRCLCRVSGSRWSRWVVVNRARWAQVCSLMPSVSGLAVRVSASMARRRTAACRRTPWFVGWTWGGALAMGSSTSWNRAGKSVPRWKRRSTTTVTTPGTPLRRTCCGQWLWPSGHTFRVRMTCGCSSCSRTGKKAYSHSSPAESPVLHRCRRNSLVRSGRARRGVAGLHRVRQTPLTKRLPAVR